MDNLQIGYACTECFISAHEGNVDTWATDWACTVGEPSIDGECLEDGDVCTGCDSTGTEHGITVGGTCDLTNHKISGYWEYHVFLA